MVPVTAVYTAPVPPVDAVGRPLIRKLGTVDCNMVETTPFVFKNRLYRVEWVRENHVPNPLGDHFRVLDMKTGESSPPFAKGWLFASAYTERGAVYAYGTKPGPEVRVFRSTDMRTWTESTALYLPGWRIYNTSVCKGPDGYVMAFEIGEPPEETGVGFTMRFARSHNLLDWVLTPSECVFSKDRYTACPALRWVDGWYYMIYLEDKHGTYEPHIVRSRDLARWEDSPRNPIMTMSAEDKRIATPRLTAEERALIAGATDINNSDVDLCEYRGKVVIMYSWGNQIGTEFLAQAEYGSTLSSFLQGFFRK
jgi:hypothetical protein